jgi:hypothetical protein
MAQDERPFINLSAKEIIEQGEQLLASHWHQSRLNNLIW